MIELNAEQKDILKMMLDGKNVFITGEAGTGKSTLIQEFKNCTKRQYVVVAPTGIAAINVGGQTIHSFFMLKPGLLTDSNIEDLVYRCKRQAIRSIQTLIIDEISMVRSDLFSAIDYRCREMASGRAKNMPFGGKQVIVCGDFYQLPPVICQQVEIDWMNENLGGCYAFQTQLWKETNFHIAHLQKIFRQQEDTTFLDMLKQVRHGNLEQQTILVDGQMLNVIDALNKKCMKKYDKEKKPVVVCTTNLEVQKINTAFKSLLTGKKVVSVAQISGTFNQKDYPTDHDLELIVGMRVMMLKNKSLGKGQFEYVNGDVGNIVDIVESQYEPLKVVVKLDNGNISTIQPDEWTNEKYVVQKDAFTGKTTIRQEEVGRFAQIPLKIAYAITIHKSQGLTLDRMHLRLGRGCFSHGQLYTAISRCKSLDGLSFDTPVKKTDLILDRSIVEFYNCIDGNDKNKYSTISIDIPIDLKDKVFKYIEQIKMQKEGIAAL